MSKHNVPQHILDMVRRAERALETDKNNARRYFKLYMGIAPRKRAKRSNLFIRKVTSFVENAVARYVDAMFQYEPYFDLESRSANNIQRADNAEKVLQFFLEQAHFHDKCITWFKASAIDNIGVMKLGWRKSVRKQKQRMSLAEAMEKVPNFNLPAEYKDMHVFLAPAMEEPTDPMIGEEMPLPEPLPPVALDEFGGVFMHEGDEMDERATALLEQGYRMVTLDQAPPEVQEPFTVVAEAPKVIYDGLELTPIPFEDCFWDTDASSVDELRFAGHFTGKTLTDLKAEKKSGIEYKNLGELESWASSGSVPDIARYRRRGDTGKSGSVSFSETETLFKIAEVWHVQDGKFYTYATTGAGSGDYADGILIREGSWPYWHSDIPYHYIPASVVPFEMVGIGIVELAEHLQIEKNELRNILMDQKVMAIAPPWLYNENAVDDPSKFQKLEPGIAIGMDLPEGMKLEDVAKQVIINPTAFQNAVMLERMVDDDMEETTGVSKTHQGVALGRRTTYSEVATLANEGNYRFKLTIRTIDQAFKRLARQAVRLLDQFCDPVIEVRISGDDGNPAFDDVDREDLSFEYDIHPASSSVSSLADNLSQSQQMIQSYSAIKGTPMEQYLRPERFLREYFRKSGIKDAERFILTDEEIQNLQAQQAQAQQMQARQAQGQQPQQPQGMGGAQGMQGAGGGMQDMQGMQDQMQPGAQDETTLIGDENDLLMAGESPPVTPDQDHMAHIEGHAELLRALVEQRGLTEETVMQDEDVIRIIDHMHEHEQMGGGMSAPGATGLPQ